MTAAELLDHPEYETSLFWDLKPAEKGKVKVAKERRGGEINLNYEVHGEGPIKLVVSLSSGLEPQYLISSKTKVSTTWLRPYLI